MHYVLVRACGGQYIVFHKGLEDVFRGADFEGRILEIFPKTQDRKNGFSRFFCGTKAPLFEIIEKGCRQPYSYLMYLLAPSFVYHNIRKKVFWKIFSGKQALTETKETQAGSSFNSCASKNSGIHENLSSVVSRVNFLPSSPS